MFAEWHNHRSHTGRTTRRGETEAEFPSSPTIQHVSLGAQLWRKVWGISVTKSSQIPQIRG